jgi:hypothetical protein
MEVFASAASPVAFALDLPRLFVGSPAASPLSHSAVCRELVLRAGEPLGYNLDGDLYDDGLELTVRTTAPVTFLLAPGSRPPAGAALLG